MTTRLPVFFVPRPDEDAEGPDRNPYIAFDLLGDWVAVDRDKLHCLVELTERNGETYDHPREGLLSQYGGEKLLNDMLLDDQPVAEGSTWLLSYDSELGFRISSIEDWDPADATTARRAAGLDDS